ncbi:hypothetical protein BTH160X_50115 [Brochothrix thermosphacta]|nr:hypothetical protein BTH160X_50115 [Brochothrix thermosphacta]
MIESFLCFFKVNVSILILKLEMIRLGKTEHYVFALTLGNDTMVGK